MLKVPTYGSWLVMSAQGYDTPEKLISSENQKTCFQTMTDLKIGAEQLDGKVSCSDVFSKSYVYSCPT